jgi:hypothetical protein
MRTSNPKRKHCNFLVVRPDDRGCLPDRADSRWPKEKHTYIPVCHGFLLQHTLTRQREIWRSILLWLDTLEGHVREEILGSWKDRGVAMAGNKYVTRRRRGWNVAEMTSTREGLENVTGRCTESAERTMKNTAQQHKKFQWRYWCFFVTSLLKFLKTQKKSAKIWIRLTARCSYRLNENRKVGFCATSIDFYRWMREETNGQMFSLENIIAQICQNKFENFINFLSICRAL